MHKNKLITFFIFSICQISIFAGVNEFPILTPTPKPQPRINAPLVYGVRPGHPFVYRIPCQGQRPMRFIVQNLPQGLILDSKTGIITGITPKAGNYKMGITAINSKGKAVKSFTLISGDKLALTPPMGWNHWYAHYDRVTDKMMREAADVMMSSGMADVGYQYVNIDDCWMNAPKHPDPKRVGAARDGDGNILCNAYFPNMKSLTNYIHQKGLRCGIYTSPGKLTCGGFTGSYQHEEKDAKQFADWGFDFLKYDWCSYDEIAKNGDSANHNIPPLKEGEVTLEGFKYPYQLMGDILKKQNRDIVFNLCQYGMGNVWQWGAQVGGNSWRTAGDLGFELDKFFDIALKNINYAPYSKPGEWNDPDYIQIGYFGAADGQGMPERTKMSANMQYAYMSIWCMMAAPLYYSGDMSKLDAFTLNVLCNPEIIEVDQDPMGECAQIVKNADKIVVLKKKMVDDTTVIGLFNRNDVDKKIDVQYSEIGLSGKRIIRNLWIQKDLGTFMNQYSTSVPSHGVVMLRIR